MQNTQVILARRPVGVPKSEHFELRDTPVKSPGDGEVLVRLTHWSVDPAMRGWANDVPNYSPPVRIGDPMRSFAVGEVISSRDPGYSEGDLVEGLLGWQTHALVPGTAIARKVTETDLPRTHALGILGLNGTTAYFGLLECCAAKEGDTVVVSTAAGAVGSAVGQIARILGCRTVGIAGGPEKTRQCMEDFGFDAAIDYKGEEVGPGAGPTLPGWSRLLFRQHLRPDFGRRDGSSGAGSAHHDLRHCGGDRVGPDPAWTESASSVAGGARPNAGLPDLRLQGSAPRGPGCVGRLASNWRYRRPRAYTPRARGCPRCDRDALSRREQGQTHHRGLRRLRSAIGPRLRFTKASGSFAIDRRALMFDLDGCCLSRAADSFLVA